LNNSSANIPELFYDIISRVVPGVAATSGVLVLLVLSSKLKLDTVLIDFVTSINFLFLVLSLAYLLGSLFGTLSQVLDVVFRYGYNPTTDYLRIRDPKSFGKKLAFYLEIVLGLPFSLLLLNEYKLIGNANHVSDLRQLITKRFGKNVLESHLNLISCRDFIRVNDKELGNVAMKMSAESAMCRNLAIVFLVLTFLSLYLSLPSAMVINALLFTLSVVNFSYRRRLYVTQIYSFYFAIEKGSSQKASKK